jgi:hypothetical protein
MSTLKEWNLNDFVLVDGKLVKSDKLVSKKVDKLPSLLPRGAENKKIRNATKVVVDGVTHDSKLEYYMQTLLEATGIAFERQKVYELQPKFNYNGEAIRAVKCIVDFWIDGHNTIVDTKGFSTAISKLKYKMLMNKLITERAALYEFYGAARAVPKIEMPQTKKECDLLLNRLLYEK